jgi:hypothetical protein
MDRKMIAKELLAVAKELLSMEFPTKDALNKYLDEHPDADRGKHKVKETKKETPKETSQEAPKGSRVDKVHKSILDKYKGSGREEFQDMGIDTKRGLEDTIRDELGEELSDEDLTSEEERDVKQRAKSIADKLWR